MDTAPLPLTDRITIALDQLRIARDTGDLIAEWFWSDIVDRLFDHYAQGYR